MASCGRPGVGVVPCVVVRVARRVGVYCPGRPVSTVAGVVPASCGRRVLWGLTCGCNVPSWGLK